MGELTDSRSRPEPGDVDAAQRRADRIRAFRAELAELRREGVLDPGQEALEDVDRYHERVLRELAERFDVEGTDRGRFLSLGMRAFSTVAALALAASVYYFFYQIWGRITTATQIGILVAVPLLALVATDRIAARERRRYFTTIAALVAFTCFVNGTALVARTFNAPLRAVVLVSWGALALVLAYGYTLRLALVAGLVLAAAAPLGVFLDAFGTPWDEGIFLRQEGLIVPGILLFFLADRVRHGRDAGFAVIYRSVGMTLMFLPVLLLASHAQDSCLPFGSETIVSLYQALGLCGSFAIIALGVRRRHRHVVYGGTLAFASLLLSAMFHWWWDWMPRYLFFFLVAASAVAILLVLRRLHASISTAARELSR